MPAWLCSSSSSGCGQPCSTASRKRWSEPTPGLPPHENTSAFAQPAPISWSNTRSGVMRTSVRSRRPWRISSCAAANGIRCGEALHGHDVPVADQLGDRLVEWSDDGHERVVYVLRMIVRHANANSRGRRWAAAWGPPLVAVACALALWELAVRAGLLSETSFPPMSETVAELGRQLGTGDFWTAVANTLQGWALGLGLAILLAVPAGHPRRLEPARLPRAARADRVPAPDPVGRADPARRARLRHRAGEQGLPRRLRVVLAAVRADALRRPGRRPGRHRHRALVRPRPASSACGGSGCRRRCPTSRPACGSPRRSR